MRTLSTLSRIAAALSVAGAIAVAGMAYADHHAIKVAKKDGLGSYLTDTKDMTLYIFKNDTLGKSACAADCLAKWPLYYREKVAVTGGLKDSDFGTITREDGKQQTTYKGMPLYYFVGDKKPGDTAGQGLRDVWYVAIP